MKDPLEKISENLYQRAVDANREDLRNMLSPQELRALRMQELHQQLTSIRETIEQRRKDRIKEDMNRFFG